jgi:hypothetical protein
VNPTRLISSLVLAATFLAVASTASAQIGSAPAFASTQRARSQQSASPRPSFKDRFFAHNYAATKVQPTWPTPLFEPDPRLTQYYRYSVSSQYSAAGTHTVSLGNNRGGGIVAFNRVEFDFLPPAYIQHHTAAADGFGDCTALVKYRMTSGNAQHGNYIVSAILNHTFASSPKNGAATDSWTPTVAGGVGFLHRFNAESTIGGTMPTGKIAKQGRSIVWNSLINARLTPHTHFEIENNATFCFSGTHDGKIQNFVTPGLFYIPKGKDWKPTHPYLVFDAGMQIATSGFHNYNHNVIAEMRVLF